MLDLCTAFGAPALTGSVATVHGSAPIVVEEVFLAAGDASLVGDVLQTGITWDAVAVALQAYELVGALLGLVVAYLAYRGYRRNDSRPMLFVSLGFVLALGLPLVIVPVYFLLPVSGGQELVQAVVQTLEIAGLLCIIYGLRL